MTLTCYEYIWCVTYTSVDDGYRLTAAYFTDRDEAEFYKNNTKLFKAEIVQGTLYQDDTGRWYKATLSEVSVDKEVLKRNAISKLTAEEIKALGL